MPIGCDSVLLNIVDRRVKGLFLRRFLPIIAERNTRLYGNIHKTGMFNRGALYPERKKMEQNVFNWPVKNTENTSVERHVAPGFRSSDTAEIKRYFQENYPIMLDGALPRSDDKSLFLRQATKSLAKGRVDPSHLPTAVLRETLESLAAKPTPATKAGLTAIGPHHARVWWDESVVDNLDDVLAQLDEPHLVLRFYDITNLDPEAERWHDAFDVDVELEEAGRTVQFWASDRTYIVDLGYVYADGRFLRLARTNTADLPRNAKGGEDEGETARCALRPRGDMHAKYVSPDAAAREWAATRTDDEERDIEAELVIHMLYRAFLEEGPRALRRAPVLVRREPGILRREFLQRERARGKTVTRKNPPAFLVARLDAGPRAEPRAVESRLPAPAAAAYEALAEDRFAWYAGLLAAARNSRTERPVTLPKAMVTRVEAEEEMLTPVAVGHGLGLPPALMAEPVFEAAAHLRESLVRIRSVQAERNRGAHIHGKLNDAETVRIFGGAEAKRMAKAGVRFTRMALTLEGKMRPGARLKVAGKLVHADADGNFRLECVLSGRRASIPMRAGASIGGEARSLINVDWEKRPSRERKHAAL